MVKVELGGCGSFVKESVYKDYVGKALAAFDVLESEKGAGNDFLGWKTLPVDTPESLIAEFEAIKADWKARGVDLAVVIGIGGSYLGARCAIEALSHQFVRQEGEIRVVFAGNNLSEDYLAELMDLVENSNAACVVISSPAPPPNPQLPSASSRNTWKRNMARRRLPCAPWQSPMQRRAPSRLLQPRKAIAHSWFQTTWAAAIPC